MAHDFRKFISEVFVNGKFPKILPSENFLVAIRYASEKSGTEEGSQFRGAKQSTRKIKSYGELLK